MTSNTSGGGMQGEFAWIIDTRSVNTKQWLVSGTYKLPELQGFEFKIHVIQHDAMWGRRMWISLKTLSSRVLDAKINISIISGGELIDNRSFEQHEWIRRCNLRHVTIPPQPYVMIKCKMIWFTPTKTSLVYSPSNLHNDMRMFESNSNKNKSRDQLVFIVDVTADVMKNVLSFLYTGCDKPLNDSEMALKMLFVAEKYEMKKLKHCCEYKLRTQLTTSNVLKVLDATDVCNAESLREECFMFMMVHKTRVLDTFEFKSLCLRKSELMYAFMKTALHY